MNDGCVRDRARDEKLLQMYKDGSLVTDIQKTFGISRQRVYQILAHYKVPSDRAYPRNPPIYVDTTPIE